MGQWPSVKLKTGKTLLAAWSGPSSVKERFDASFAGSARSREVADFCTGSHRAAEFSLILSGLMAQSNSRRYAYLPDGH